MNIAYLLCTLSLLFIHIADRAYRKSNFNLSSVDNVAQTYYIHLKIIIHNNLDINFDETFSKSQCIKQLKYLHAKLPFLLRIFQMDLILH